MRWSREAAMVASHLVSISCVTPCGKNWDTEPCRGASGSGYLAIACTTLAQNTQLADCIATQKLKNVAWNSHTNVKLLIREPSLGNLGLISWSLVGACIGLNLVQLQGLGRLFG
jgi:hypothetical protein